MFIIYTVLILIASFPALITLKRIQKYRTIRQNGINTTARITNTRMQPFYRGRQILKLTLEFTRIEDGRLIETEVTTVNDFKVGEQIKISYERNKSKIYIHGDEKNYRPMLIFGIILFLFAIGASFGIHDMVVNGY